MSENAPWRPFRDTGAGEKAEFPFRHYLAASWAARFEVDPISLFEQDAKVFRHARTEQEVVWEFFAELLDRERCEPLLQWSDLEIERAVLRHALLSRVQAECSKEL